MYEVSFFSRSLIYHNKIGIQEEDYTSFHLSFQGELRSCLVDEQARHRGPLTP